MTRWNLLVMTALLAAPALAVETVEHAPETAPALTVEPFAAFVAPADSLPRLKFFADGKTSLNDRCPVRRVKLNPKMGASYVNDEPVGFC